MSALTRTPSITPLRRTSYGVQISVVLVVAFTLSATHTTYSWIAGIGDKSFTVTTPAAWLFYAVGFASAALALSQRRWVQWITAGYLCVLLWVALFWYPTTFVPRQQTTFGWFENDVYTALLLLALYLVVQRLRGLSIVSEVSTPADDAFVSKRA